MLRGSTSQAPLTKPTSPWLTKVLPSKTTEVSLLARGEGVTGSTLAASTAARRANGLVRNIVVVGSKGNASETVVGDRGPTCFRSSLGQERGMTFATLDWNTLAATITPISAS